MEQLILSHDELIKIGFERIVYPETPLNSEKVCYEIPCMNGVFYFNSTDKTYKWYHRVDMLCGSNHTLLDITNAPSLFMILSCFKVKFNLFII